MTWPVPKRLRRMVPEPAPPAAGCESSILDDILFFQILVLLPVKCLVRFQSVCKLWRSTITSAPFMRRHLELSRARSLTVLMPRKYLANRAKLRSRFVNIYGFQVGKSEHAELIFQKNLSPHGIPMFSMPLHCDGMILIPCLTGETFLCNPATREWVELPPGSRSVLQDHSVAFGFDPSRGTYKVARHYIRSYVETPQVNGQGGAFREYSCGHEILTLGAGEEAWEWKGTVDPPYPIKARTPVCLPGFFYWSALHSVQGKVHTDVILRFSMQDETFTVHPNPPCRGFFSENDVLSELGGNLCYVHSVWPLEVAIWLAEDGPTLDWSLRCRVNLPLPMLLRVHPCASAEPDRIYLSVDTCYLFRCNLSDGSLEKIANMAQDVLYESGDGRKFTTGAHQVAHYVVPFVESLLRIRPG